MQCHVKKILYFTKRSEANVYLPQHSLQTKKRKKSLKIASLHKNHQNTKIQQIRIIYQQLQENKTVQTISSKEIVLLLKQI